MSYVKTVWETGDVITAEKLNNAESGIEAAQPFIVRVSVDLETGKSTMDKTYAEIRAALMAGKYIPVIVNAIPEIQMPEDMLGSVLFARVSDTDYNIIIAEGINQITAGYDAVVVGYFTADAEDGYPERSES